MRPARFLDNTWKLLPESNPALHSPLVYTVRERAAAPTQIPAPIQKSPEYEDGLLAYGYSILMDHVEKQNPGCVGNALKWFPDRRGLAAGLTAAGFGAGSALTVAPIQAMIKDSGFQNTFLYFGLGQGIIVVILAASCSLARRSKRARE